MVPQSVEIAGAELLVLDPVIDPEEAAENDGGAEGALEDAELDPDVPTAVLEEYLDVVGNKGDELAELE